MTLATTRQAPAEALRQLERVVIEGDLSVLSDGERIAYVARVCESLGLNPLTKPFEFVKLNGKLIIYAKKDATDQLRQIHGVTVHGVERERDDEHGLYSVTTHVRDRYGREDSDIGVVSIKGLSGEALANAMMKASTKSKRRATLSIVGLGWMDEIEALDQRAIEVAPRQALTTAIAERTAALTGGTEHPERSSDVEPPPSTDTEGTSAPESQPGKRPGARSSSSSPAPRARGRRVEPSLKPGDAGYGNARAHAVAAERGLDHAAVHRIAADVLLVEEADLADFSVKNLDEVAWEQVIAVISEAPADDSEAETFAGRQALMAGMGSGDDPWPEAEPAAAEMFDEDASALTPVQWREFGIRVAARNPLP